tara:strand:+ start:296 stop:871 length:576 start_codon:yes stop_codon:yes gene_type:complete
MILIIDNYDSFTYNLVQVVGTFTKNIVVVRNDKISISEIENIKPNRIILSPGPGHPIDSGICMNIVARFVGKIPILGVCLGFQVIAHFFGVDVVRAQRPFHGKTSILSHSETGIFKNIPQNVKIARYHSLKLLNKSIPKKLLITGRTDDIVMAFEHKIFPGVYGVQFHPESFMTECGSAMIENFLQGSVYD